MRGMNMRGNALLIGLALGGCGNVAQGPSNIRWSGAQPGAAAAQDADYYTQAKGQLAAGSAALAIDGFRKALRANPRSIDALNGLGAAYDRIGRFDLSRNYYERALGLDPGSRITLNNFGYSLALQGKAAEAKEMLARANVGATGRLAVVAAHNLAQITAPKPVAVQGVQQPAPRPRSWVERLTTSTQLLVTQLVSRVTTPALTSVSRDSASIDEDRPAQFSAEYHRQRIALDSGQLAEMASDEIMSGTEHGAPVLVLNGVGRRGMAGRVASFLAGKGYAQMQVGDAERPIVRSEIIYPDGSAEIAAAVAARLPFAVDLKASAKVRSITVKLGSDATRFDDRLRHADRIA